MIRVSGLSKSFDGGRTYAVRDVSLHVPDGKTLVLLGSSGSGKTTLLRMVNRLVEPTAGTIEVDGTDIMQRDPVVLRQSIGYVFQRIGLFPHMTVADNVTIGLRLEGMAASTRRKRAEGLLDAVGLPPAEYAGRYPAELSGGQAQRVGVARALATNPKCLLMDEPFGALDEITRETLRQSLKTLRARFEKTIVFVTHDLFEALDLGDEIAVMHEGRLEQVADGPTLLKNPATPFVEQLFRKPVSLLKA